MASPQKIQDVETPAFLVDIDTVKGNVERMQQRSEKLGVKLRPHMKTHKTMYESFATYWGIQLLCHS